MSTYSIGQMNQLGDALELAGFTPDEVTKLRNSRLLPEVRKVLLGHAEITVPDHLIDCDAAPYCSDGFEVVEHQQGGMLKWEKKVQKDALYLHPSQQNGGYIRGHHLRKALKGQKVLNANVLDYLLAHPHLIPEEWKVRAVFFWGTIYRYRDGHLHVRYLLWGGDEWDWYADWLGNDWSGSDPAAVPAS